MREAAKQRQLPAIDNDVNKTGAERAEETESESEETEETESESEEPESKSEPELEKIEPDSEEMETVGTRELHMNKAAKENCNGLDQLLGILGISELEKGYQIYSNLRARADERLKALCPARALVILVSVVLNS